MNGAVIWQLILLLAPLSLVAIGGVNSVLPEIHRQVVGVHGWVTDGEFADLFALAQAAPGPNIALLVTLIGWKLAGVVGVVAALLAISVPSGLLAYAMTRTWHRFRAARWRRPVQAGLAPVAVGFVLASGLLLTRAADTTPVAYAVSGATALLVLRTRLHPLLIMAAAAALAVAGWL
ncbi:MAG TPA: chromate transporter [Chloroflexota bacterium]|nr:chromate transporter [Chloroflexota bacterium]